jgi:ATP-dependent helicase IRC3
MKLRPYQEAMLDAVVSAACEGKNRVLLQAATGTGKTVMFSALPDWPDMRGWLESFPEHERRVLIIAHREELLDQAAQKILASNPARRVSIEQGERHASRFSDIVIASIQTLQAQKFRRLHRLLKHHVFRVVIVDEAHHAAAPTYRTALAHLGFLPMADASDSPDSEAASFDDVAKMRTALGEWEAIAPKDRILIGVTATPNRTDEVGLECVFQTLAYSYPIRAAIRDGWLVPIVPWVIETDVSLDQVKMSGQDFNQKSLAEAVNQEARNKLAVAGWLEKGQRRPTIAFTVDVAHAHALAAAFREQGLRAMPISGETPKDERRGILRRFREGEIDIITNCMVLTEGTDLPIAACILHAKPTKSASLYEQMTGRGLRPHPSDPVGPDRLAHRGAWLKPDCILIDVVDVSQRHALCAAPGLYGLPPAMVGAGETLEDMAEQYDEIAALCPGIDLSAFAAKLTLEQLRARARTFDIWQLPDLGELGRVLRFDWVKVSDDLYRLQFPISEQLTEMIAVGRNVMGAWQVIATIHGRRQRGESRQDTIEREPQTLGQDLPSVLAACRLAESHIYQQRRSALVYVDKRAEWKHKPPSRGQLEILRRMKVPVREGMMRGEVSRLIDLAMARKHLERKQARA